MANRGLDNKISNIVGTKVPQWLIQQLDNRANRNSDDVRSNQNLLYLANKTAWVRLVSSVDIDQPRDQEYFSRISQATINNPQSLAKQFVLFGGTSKYKENNSYELRSGFSYSDPNKTSGGAYGILGRDEIQKYGYRPMPGITSVNIETQGRLGSVRAAVINFKCWDKQQLDIIDALYFKLGFTMFLEWGHTYFYTSKNESEKTLLRASEDYALIDPFRSPSLTKEEIYSQISKVSTQTEGNYDAMLGMVTNFNFAYNQDGGYDCTLRIMALGMLGDSIKINNPSTLPNLLEFQVLLLQKTLSLINEQQNLPGTENTLNPEDDPKNQTILRILNRKINNVDKEPENAQKSVIIDRAGILNSENKEIKYNSNTSTGTQLIDPSSIKNYDFIYPIQNSYRFYSQKFGIQIDEGAESSFVDSISLDISKLREKININFAKYLQNRKNTVPLFNSIDSYLYNIENTNKGSTKNSEYSSDYLFYTSGVNNKIYYFKISIPDFEILTPEIKNLSTVSVPELIAKETKETGDQIKSFIFNAISKLKISVTNDPINVQIKKIESLIRRDIQLKVLQKLSGVSISNDISPEINLTFSGQDVDLKIVEDTQFQTFTNPEIISQNINPEILKRISSTNQGKSYRLKFSGTYFYPTREVEKQYTNDGSKTVFGAASAINVPFTIETNDFSLVSNVVPVNNPNLLLGDYLQKQSQEALNSQNKEEAAKKEQQKQDDEALLDQIQQSLSYQSALELSLRTIQVYALNKAIWQIENQPDVNIGNKIFVLPVTDKKYSDLLQTIFSNGLFSPFIDELIQNSPKKYSDDDLNISNSNDRLKIYSNYGFLSSLLGGKSSLEEVNSLNGSVNYNKLLTAFVIPYRIQQELVAGIKTNHPVYIPFGFLLMLLNHSCSIYDSKKSSNLQTPLVYIDYNPELNFFLTNKQQLSTDPFKVLIPFEGTDSDYQKLFYDEVLVKDKTGIAAYKDQSKSVALFKPQSQDLISFKLQEYCPIKFTQIEDGIGTAAFRGRLMNILLSVDYLTDLVRQYSLKDGSNNVYLRPFLENILTTINKSLGNFNSFRLSYNDSSNTFQIVDDQVVPTLGQEQMIDPKSSGLEPANRTEIPLIGKTSIAKSLETRTDIASKLGSLIAISANPIMKNKSTLSTNADALGYLNSGFSDRYVTNRLAIESNNTSSLKDSRIAEAIMFNSTIADFYSSANPSDGDVSQVTSYYIEKMSKVKNEHTGSLAAAMVPLGINFTTDGIGGLNMYQAFTVSDELLPYSYTMQYRPGYIDNYSRYVGFVIVGLTHTIEANQWNTSVRTNMIAVKDKTDFKEDVIKLLPKNEGEFTISDKRVSSETISFINNTPWSAAFVSYVMYLSGISFPSNSSHIGYLNSLRNSTGFELLDPIKTKVQNGDLVVFNRFDKNIGKLNNQRFSSNPYSGASHGDIIIDTNNNIADSIGGNVANKVTKTSYELNNGIIKNINVFVILRPKTGAESIVNAAKLEYNDWLSNNWIETNEAALPRLRAYYKVVNLILP